MLSDCEKMVAISSTTNEWPQNHQMNEKNLMASTSRLMEKVLPGQETQQQQPLKCPRCDSSNTKFCYYNNYSLSQPRHFCKACKRYWTRGGTLRNVPVGGGCRKNKRVKRPAGAASNNSIDGSSSSITTSAAATNPNPHISPLFYGLSTTNPTDMNFPFSRFNNSRVSSTVVETISGYDLQPQFNALGLGFSSSSGLIMSNDAADGNNNYRSGFNNQTSTDSLLSSYPSFVSSSSPTMASLLASSLHHQQKLINGGLKCTQAPNNHFNNLASFEELQVTANNGEAERIGAASKEMKAEEGVQNRMDWNQMEQIGLADPTLYWNTNSVGPWHDPSNIGSSVTSLI